MPSYPTVDLEGPPEGEDKPAPLPIVSHIAHRDAWATDGPCSLCGAPCSTFADAVHEDGSVSGWVRVCETCTKAHKDAAKAAAEAAKAAAAEAPAEPAVDPAK